MAARGCYAGGMADRILADIRSDLVLLDLTYPSVKRS